MPLYLDFMTGTKEQFEKCLPNWRAVSYFIRHFGMEVYAPDESPGPQWENLYRDMLWDRINCLREVEPRALLEYTNTHVALCSKCGEYAVGMIMIESLFSTRLRKSGIRVAQSWCLACRREERTETRARYRRLLNQANN